MGGEYLPSGKHLPCLIYYYSLLESFASSNRRKTGRFWCWCLSPASTLQIQTAIPFRRGQSRLQWRIAFQWMKLPFTYSVPCVVSFPRARRCKMTRSEGENKRERERVFLMPNEILPRGIRIGSMADTTTSRTRSIGTTTSTRQFCCYKASLHPPPYRQTP